MALDLNDEKAINYSDKIEFFPFDTYGDFEFDVISYTESGPAGSDQNKSDKEFDLATVRVVRSTNETVKAGDLFSFFFQTGGNGISIKSRPYRAAELRSFHKAVMKVAPTDKTFDANKARKTLLENDLSEGGNPVRLKTSKGNSFTREDGTTGNYRNDTWAAAE